MTELQHLTRAAEDSTETDRADTPEADAPGLTLDVAGTSATVSGDPTEAEAAALAAVLAEHLRAEAEAEEEPRYAVDPWCLAGRLGRRSRSGVPAACPSGREWKLAGRASHLVGTTPVGDPGTSQTVRTDTTDFLDEL